ncbi:hypothetical protein DACRYDRAFT_102205 [Dacryopinax primogenitus]|uniref:Uncharacterized protein n=1 Tax=Dacryopinax primogenitus (strain DJM 731) TaxID=1858805 RepID=M5FQT3_DACPD|nr:uncharacterized protein DACRYDRAFT_102205 [Dacryopinax primogenitus]EJT97933.1 hypothetical protein DACRYDRAFT_102205 [Dacryopinax primogenitus]
MDPSVVNSLSSPITSLPPELLTYIFELSITTSPESGTTTVDTSASIYAARISTLFHLLRVSRSWRLVVLPMLYKNIVIPLQDPFQASGMMTALREGGKGEMVHQLEVDDVPEWKRHPPPEDEGLPFDLPPGTSFDQPILPTSDSTDPLADESPFSPLRLSLLAITLCPHIRTLVLTLRLYPSPRAFSALCTSLLSLQDLQNFEIRSKEQNPFRGHAQGAVLFTPDKLLQMVLPLKGLRRLNVSPVSHGTNTSTYHYDNATSEEEKSSNQTHDLLRQLTATGTLYTVDILCLLRPFPSLRLLHLHLARESCITHECLARVLWRLRATIEDVEVTCTPDNLRFTEKRVAVGFGGETWSRSTTLGKDGEDVEGLWKYDDFPVERVLPHLIALHTLALNIYNPRAAWSTSLSTTNTPGSVAVVAGGLFSREVFGALPMGLRVLRADIGDVSPTAVARFLRKVRPPVLEEDSAASVKVPLLPGSYSSPTLCSTRRLGDTKEKRNYGMLKFNLAVWGPSWREQADGIREDAELRTLVVDELGGKYELQEGWTKGFVEVVLPEVNEQ